MENSEQRAIRIRQPKTLLLALILMLLFSLAFSNCPALCQSDSPGEAAALVDKIIDAQMKYDFVVLDKLEKKLSEMANSSVPDPGDPQARQDAMQIFSNNLSCISSQRVRQGRVAARKAGLNNDAWLSDKIRAADYVLGDADTLKADCYASFLDGSVRANARGQVFTWLGIAYAMEGDNKKSVACFTIARKLGGGESPSSMLVIYKPCPAANRNFQQALKELKAEADDRLKLKYGE